MIQHHSSIKQISVSEFRFDTHLIGRQEQTDADRYERNADQKEQRQNCVRGQDGLPCW